MVSRIRMDTNLKRELDACQLGATREGRGVEYAKG